MDWGREGAYKNCYLFNLKVPSIGIVPRGDKPRWLLITYMSFPEGISEYTTHHSIIIIR